MDEMVNFADFELLFDPIGVESDLLVNNDILDEIVNYCDTENIDTDVLLNGLESFEPDVDLFAIKPWISNDGEQLLHDCMWTGHCGNKDHPSEELVKPLVTPLLPTPVAKVTPPSSRSILIKSVVKTPPQEPTNNTNLSPDSPPISDDEDSKKTPTFNMLADAIVDQHTEVTDDIINYFEKDERTPPKQQNSSRGESDHSYHKEKWMGNFLGIDTPSDSGECLFKFNVIRMHVVHY